MGEHDEFEAALAVAAATATLQNLSVVGALAECHVIDPAKVAEWAQFFASELETSTAGSLANLEHAQKVAARIRDYARQLVNVVSPPTDESE